MVTHHEPTDYLQTMNPTTPDGMRRIRQAFDRYLEQAEHAGFKGKYSQSHFAASIGLPCRAVSLVVTAQEFEDRRRVWLRHQLLAALVEVQREARIQDDISLSRIAAVVGLPFSTARKLIGDEWCVARASMPTARQRVLATIDALVDADIPWRELTEERIYAEANVSPYHGPWFRHARRDAVRRLKETQIARVIDIEPPTGMDARVFDGGWVDISSDTFDLRFASNGVVLRRASLRPDLAEIAWSLLQDDLRSPDITPGTLHQHYYGYQQAGTFLGKQVPDVHQACLEDVQRAWVRYDGSPPQRRKARWALEQLFRRLARDAGADTDADADEFRRIVRWLGAARTSRHVSKQEFLSADELKAVYHGCMADVQAGVAYASACPDLLQFSTSVTTSQSAEAIVLWGDALCILLFAFTALRPASVLGIEKGDWGRVRAGLYALKWAHPKKREEGVAVLYEGLALLLDQYVERTVSIRASIGTARVFLGADGRGGWTILTRTVLGSHIHRFVKRHGITRDGVDLPLGPTIQRRTYVTRGLAEGKTIAALSAQLGHASIKTTMGYAKYDRSEHPDKVGPALDRYGRESLGLWDAPQRLEDLSPLERAKVLGARIERDQGVGLCGYDRCIMADDGAPPPCSLCKNLRSGPEFREEWDRERAIWLRRIERLQKDPASGTALAQVIGLYDTFERNYSLIHGEGE